MLMHDTGDIVLIDREHLSRPDPGGSFRNRGEKLTSRNGLVRCRTLALRYSRNCERNHSFGRVQRQQRFLCRGYFETLSSQRTIPLS